MTIEAANLRIKKLNQLKTVIKNDIEFLMDESYYEFLTSTNNYKELADRHYETSRCYARLIEIDNEIKHIENCVLTNMER